MTASRRDRAAWVAGGRLAAAALAATLGPVWSRPALADSEMKQSPLLMRRAGPSCRPGDLGAEPGAGYRYWLGPCAGPDGGEAPPAGSRRGRRAR